MQSILSVANLVKHFEGFTLGPVSFDLPKGCILGLIGKNGCGKTTLLRMILGSYRFRKEDQGEMILNGHSNKEQRVFLSQLAYVLNETPFEKKLSSVDQGLIYGRYYETFDMNRYIGKLKEFQIPVHRPVQNLSKGEQIKQQLAFALSYDAKIYVMDEPAGNLDLSFREEFYKQVRSLTEDEEKSVIFASHLIEELEGFCDMFLWLSRNENRSNISFFGTADELRESYRMVEGKQKLPDSIAPQMVIGKKQSEYHSEYLIRYHEDTALESMKPFLRYPDLKEIFYYVEKNRKEGD